MTAFKICVSILCLATLMSCSADELTLDQIVHHSVAFEKQEVTLDSAKFSLMIPADWSWQNEKNACDGKNLLLMLSAGSPADKKGYINVLWVQKIKSQCSSNDLETEFNHLLALAQKNSEKLVESGKTNALNYPAYFIHTKSNSGSYGETETITFILKSEEEGYYYHLIAGASQTTELKNNMSILIQSCKTFRLKL